jgi:hypothetical protein
VSARYPEITGRKLDVIGIYAAWRGLDITMPVAKFLTFWSRKSTGYTIAALATISELGLAARAPDKTYRHRVLLGHSFGLVLENTISHSILDASSTASAVERDDGRWGRDGSGVFEHRTGNRARPAVRDDYFYGAADQTFIWSCWSPPRPHGRGFRIARHGILTSCSVGGTSGSMFLLH